jgi:uncharacterized protein YbbK (DUF523 family)/uncharacterized protein YbgA (DUF1722 family)
LLGQRVRYDGGHKRDGFIADGLARCVEYAPICPEVAIGLGVPRPTLRLVDDARGPRAQLSADPHRDVTSRLERFAEQQVTALAGVDGFVLKSGSPSCGLGDIRPPAPGGGQSRSENLGVFARVLRGRMPHLPVTDERRLGDAALRDAFLTRVFARARWNRLVAAGARREDLDRFHAAHRLLILARSRRDLERLDQLLAEAQGADAETLAQRYFARFSAALERPSRRSQQAAVLLQLLADLGGRVGSLTKRAIAEKIEAYRRGEVTLAEPVALLRRRRPTHPDQGVRRQLYFEPYPAALRVPDGA